MCIRDSIFSCPLADTVSLSRFLSGNLQQQFNMVLSKFVICSFVVYLFLPGFVQEGETSLVVFDLGFVRARFSGEYCYCVYDSRRQP